MTTGVVFRSAKLATLSAADSKRLTALGLGAVLDLRTPKVARSSPDPKIVGAKNTLINLYAVSRSAKPKLRTVSAAKAYMRKLNIGFVAKAAQRKRVAKTLVLIASAQRPVLVHCTEGKDRTGWIAAVLQLTAGASRSQVLREYLASNVYRKTIIETRYQATKIGSGKEAALIERAQLKVSESYLLAGLTEVKRRYGSFANYLTKGLGLSQATVERLRARLVAG